MTRAFTRRFAAGVVMAVLLALPVGRGPLAAPPGVLPPNFEPHAITDGQIVLRVSDTRTGVSDPPPVRLVFVPPDDLIPAAMERNREIRAVASELASLEDEDIEERAHMALSDRLIDDVGELWEAGLVPVPEVPVEIRPTSREFDGSTLTLKYTGLKEGFYLAESTSPSARLRNEFRAHLSENETGAWLYPECEFATGVIVTLTGHGGAPVADARVRLVRSDGFGTVELAHAGGGLYRGICGAPADAQIVAESLTAGIATVPVYSVVAGEQAPVALRLTVPASVRVRVTSARGPVPDTALRVLSTALLEREDAVGQYRSETYTPPSEWVNGSTVFRNVVPGRYRVSIAERCGLHAASAPFVVAEGSTRDVTLTADRGLSLTVTAADETGTPAAGVTVMAQDAGGAESALSAVTERNGVAVVHGLHPQREYRVSAAGRIGDRTGESVPIAVSGGGACSLTLTRMAHVTLQAPAGSDSSWQRVSFRYIASQSPAAVGGVLTALSARFLESMSELDAADVRNLGPGARLRATRGSPPRYLVGVPAGTGTLLVTPYGGTTTAVPLTLKPAEDRQVTVTAAAPGTIQLRMLTAAGAVMPQLQAVEYRMVADTAGNTFETPWYDAVFPRTGPPSISRLQPGRYQVRTRGGEPLAVDVAPGKSADAVLRWPHTNVVHGRVYAPDGKPAVGVTVLVTPHAPPRRLRSEPLAGRSDASGVYRVDHVPPGAAQIQTASSESGYFGSTIVFPGGNPLDIQLTEPDPPAAGMCRVVLRVTSGGLPVPGAMAGLMPAMTGVQSLTDSLGRAPLDLVEPGGYGVYVNIGHDWTIAEVTRVRVRAGEPVQVLDVDVPVHRFRVVLSGVPVPAGAEPMIEFAVPSDGFLDRESDLMGVDHASLSAVLAVPPGRYRFAVRAGNAVSEDVVVALPLRTGEPIVVPLLATGSVEAVLPAGMEIQGGLYATRRGVPEDRGAYQSLQPGPPVIAGLLPGTWDLAVEGNREVDGVPQRVRAEATVEVRAGVTARVILEPAPLPVLRVRVAGPNGAPVRDVAVVALPTAEMSAVGPGAEHRDRANLYRLGTAVVTPAGAGPYTVLVYDRIDDRAGRLRARIDNIKASPGDPVDITVTVGDPP